MLKQLVLLAIFLGSARVSAEQSSLKNYRRSFTSYEEYSQTLSQLISSAGEVVWIASAQIDDGDITNSLFLSRYRQVQVAVLLAAQSIKHFSSQFPWLQAHQIPVGLTKQNLFKTWSTFIIIDGSLLLASASLVPRTRKTQFLIRSGRPDFQVKSFVRLFKSQFLQNIKQNTPSLGLSLRALAAKPKEFNNEESAAWSGFQPYRYGSRRTRTPADVARRLPRKTKWQKLGKSQRKDKK